MAIPVVSIVGKSDSGKTTLLCGIIQELKKRNYKIATIKHDVHGFDIDKPGKDTWKHAQAGADTVVISSPRKIAQIEQVSEELSLDQVISRIKNVDLILTEGYKRNNKPKIEIFRSTVHDHPLCTLEDNLLAVASDIDPDLGVPVFSTDDYTGIADLIEFFIRPCREKTMEKIRVFIVDEQEAARLGLRGLLTRYENMDVVGEASSGEDAVQLIPAVRPDVALVDTRLPGISGIETCRLIRSVMPDLPVVFLSSFADPEEAQFALNAGGTGYIRKNITGKHVISALKSVMCGKTYVDPEVSGQNMTMVRLGKSSTTLPLTKREEDIILLLAQGKTNREIGSTLLLSEKTVRNHVSRILDKLGLANRSQAAAYVARRDLLKAVHASP
jgi:molybdopterin-guanine dinucleotide biosynthesis adapter protein